MSCGVTSNRRWPPVRPLAVLVAAAAAAFTAIHLRDRYGWEDRDALVALGIACGAAGALAGTVVGAWRRRIDLALADALVAGVLVTPLIVLYYFVKMALTADYS